MSLLRTTDLRARGVGSSQVRRMLRDAELFQLRRGAFSTKEEAGFNRHLALIRATVPALGGQAVLSHTSAAVLHGLPVALALLNRVTYTSPGPGGGRVGEKIHQYRTPLPPDDIEEVDDLRRTTMARTVVDLARTIDRGLALSAADAALRRGVQMAELEAQLALAKRRRGLAQARTIVNFADARSESPGESISRLRLWELGLPAPELQYDVEIGGVRYRPDFAWPQWRLLGEFDGKVKYVDSPDGDTAADVVMREKRREVDLRTWGWSLVRWTWADAMNPAKLDALVRSMLLQQGWRPDAD